MPLAVVVWESVPTSVSNASAGASATRCAAGPSMATRQKRSMFSWWQMPCPGGTILTFSKDTWLHLRKAKRSALRSASIRAFSAAAQAQETTSAATE